MTASTTDFPDISDPRLSWSSLSQLASMPSSKWQQWLLDAGSLTQLLVHKSGGDFRVQVLEEKWLKFENELLLSQFGPLTSDQDFWSRKVILWGNGRPWVMAHTLVPQHSFLSPLKEVIELNTKPLGEYLFSHTELIRSGMQIAEFKEAQWGRRSVFFLFSKPIMVAEFFLPELLSS